MPAETDAFGGVRGLRAETHSGNLVSLAGSTLRIRPRPGDVAGVVMQHRWFGVAFYSRTETQGLTRGAVSVGSWFYADIYPREWDGRYPWGLFVRFRHIRLWIVPRWRQPVTRG